MAKDIAANLRKLAGGVLEAVKTFADLKGLDCLDREELGCAIQDLMADLMHLADEEQFDANQLLHWAVMDFEEGK